MEQKKKIKLKKFKRVTRTFLNKEKRAEPSVIVSKVKISKQKYSSGIFDDSQLIMTDCSKTITLDLGVFKKSVFNNSLYKLDQIIKVCQETKENLIEGRKHYKKQKALRKLADEQEKQEKLKTDGNTQKDDAGK